MIYLCMKTEGDTQKIWVMRDEPYGVARPMKEDGDSLSFVPHVDGMRLPEEPTLTCWADKSMRQVHAAAMLERT